MAQESATRLAATRAADRRTTDDGRRTTAALRQDPTTRTASRFTFHASRFTRPWLLVLAFLFLTALAWGLAPAPARASHPGNVIYVDRDAMGGNNGSSWGDAYTSLQSALTHAITGTEIWVATGVYTPGLTQADTFSLKNGVAIYGGFAGSETQRSQRDWTANVTVLSGDIGGDDVKDPDGVVTDADNIVGTNSYHVVTDSGTNGTARLDGVVVTAGQANAGTFPNNSGGGMYNAISSPVLANVIFSANTATYGGGMYNSESSSALANVIFSANSASYGGGAMYNVRSSPALANVTFSANSAEFGGGGMLNEVNSSPTLANVTFSANSAEFRGGGMYNEGSSNPTLANVTFSANSADRGGGMFNGNSSPSLTNVTFSANSANQGGGMYNQIGSSPTVRNSILWGNSGGQIVSDGSSSPAVQYSIVDGGYISGSNILDANPRFVDADGADNQAGTPDDNLRLRWSSPAIDAGNNSLVLSDTLDLDGDNNTTEAVPLDLDGKPRFVNHPRSDTANGDIVDMGAYETGVPDLARWYVDDTAAGENDGSSWANAFKSLRDGLALAGSGDEIWVATGVYTPGLSRTDTFALKNEVAIYGGFAATETLRSQRDWSANVTVLSGDISGDDTTDATGVVTRTANIVGTNSYHVVTGSGTNGTARLDGFTVTAGQANGGGFPGNFGGGMLNDAGSPTLANVTFSANSASFGGGMYNINSSSPALANVTFSANSAGTNGGGMFNDAGSPTLANVTFSANSASGGGGMYNQSSSPALANVTFSTNSASEGGGMFNYDNSSPTLANVTFSANSASDDGGGMFNYDSSPTLANVTFSANSARDDGGGMFNYDNSSPTVRNSILWGNSGGQIGNVNGAAPTVEYSIVEGSSVNPGTGNTNANPRFVDADGADNQAGTPDDNLRLQNSSPAIDAGNNSLVVSDTTDLDGDSDTSEAVPLDLDLKPRFVDHPRADTPTGPPSIVDMGAYEADILNSADDDEFGLRYDGWVRISDTLASGGGMMAGFGRYERIGYRAPIHTRSITLIGYRGPDQGKARVIVDGVVKGTYDFYSPSPQYGYELPFTGLARRRHTIEVVVLNEKRAASKGRQVRVDAFQAGSARAEEDDLLVRYNGWSAANDGKDFGGSKRLTRTNGDAVFFYVEGDSFTWISDRGPNRGWAQIFVDRVARQQVNLYSAEPESQHLVQVSGLGPGTHLVKISALGLKGIDGGDRWVAFDGYTAP